jgi:hypothetical protein
MSTNRKEMKTCLCGFNGALASVAVWFCVKPLTISASGQVLRRSASVTSEYTRKGTAKEAPSNGSAWTAGDCGNQALRDGSTAHFLHQENDEQVPPILRYAPRANSAVVHK